MEGQLDGPRLSIQLHRSRSVLRTVNFTYAVKLTTLVQ